MVIDTTALPTEQPQSHLQTQSEIPGSELCRRCDPTTLGFDDTDALPDLQDVIGQPRAFKALELGCEVSGQGYNIFVLGIPGSGRTTLSTEYLKRRAIDEATPADWCYVNNFESAHKPRAIQLPAGYGLEFKKDLAKLVEIAENELPRAFESEVYTHTRDSFVNDLKKTQEAEFIRLQEFVEKYKFTIVRTPFGIVLAPALNGKPISAEDLQNLSQEHREKLEELQQKLGVEVEKSIIKLRELAHSTSEKIIELNNRTALFLVSPLIDQLKRKYADNEAVMTHLDALQVDMIANATQFRATNSPEQPTPPEMKVKDRYAVNVLVDNSKTEGAPVIFESQPAYYNLLGRTEHIVVMGASRTDFNMIRPGALHRANGGYLVLSARDLLISPYAWEGLKRVLRDGEIRLIDLGSQLGLLSTETLEPEPIPLDVKIILVGTPLLYYLLRQYDEDFAKLFKVRAEFATLMERTPETEREYGLFVKSVVMDNQLSPFDRTAVARIIEYSSRLAEDQFKLSTRFGKISDLIREAAYWYKKSNLSEQTPELVSAEAVQQAIDEMDYRSNLIENRLQEVIDQGILLIDVQSRVAGQINALSVYQLGDHSFGKPTRVTASVYAGRTGVVDIERQAKLSGPIHTKGILILTGFLGGRYGRVSPLNLTASLTFEQSYDEVEGDSASAAELISLLSAIAGIPIRQDRAITGSINQLGQIQAIGGVNEKIEGFFVTCKSKGFTGEQGVIIPDANRRNLMLGAEVVAAVEQGKFHIWAIKSVDQAIELLTGYPIGEPQPDGTYPTSTFNQAVFAQLSEFSMVSDQDRKKESLNQDETLDKQLD